MKSKVVIPRRPPYVPCADGKHYTAGLVERFDRLGNREMRICECRKRWWRDWKQAVSEANKGNKQGK